MKKFMSISALFSLGMFMMMPVMAGATDETRETRVSNRSSASVQNIVISGANSGFNYADGSYGGDGGNGGEVESEAAGGDSEIGGVETGAGGRGGSSGDGALIQTGSAVTETGIVNVVNTNRTVVDDAAGAGDDDIEYNALTVRNRSRAEVGNGAASLTNTGANGASGSYAGYGGNGGDVESYADGDEDSEIGGATTGVGGAGGNSGMGGTVVTGDSRTSTLILNVVNRNVTRALR